MAVCKLCGTDGLDWSENPDLKTGRHFLYNGNSGARHNCVERAFCHSCLRTLPSFEHAKRHLLTSEEHSITVWRNTSEEEKNNAILLNVPLQAVKR